MARMGFEVAAQMWLVQKTARAFQAKPLSLECSWAPLCGACRFHSNAHVSVVLHQERANQRAGSSKQSKWERKDDKGHQQTPHGTS